MNYLIRHRTIYQYASQVFLEPHHFYFHPAPRNYLSVRSFEINVRPTPAGLSNRIDPENNAYHQCWFNDPIDRLEIEVTTQVESTPINPFNFLIEAAGTFDHAKALSPYLDLVNLTDPIVQWVEKIKELSGDNAVTLLSFLSREICSDWEHLSRYEPTLLHPTECFEGRSGSCRDLSWMMIQMLRSVQIPSRFVSGYAFNPELGEGHELHAWVEAWLPGAGWIGVDPSAGLLTTEHYIPAAMSHAPENTFPVQGRYRGSGGSTLSFEVEINAS